MSQPPPPTFSAAPAVPAPAVSVEPSTKNFTPPSAALDLDALIDYLRPHLARVVCVVNGKGGTGKTTLTANLGVLLAEVLASTGSAKRVLLVDMDPQGNLNLDLGYKDREGDDGGAGLEDAILRGKPLRILRDVRPHLDVVPGGEELDLLGTEIITRVTKKGEKAWLGLATALAAVAEDYDYIIIDCPPGEKNIQHLVLNAARWTLIPVQFDEGSRNGLTKVSARFIDASRFNPDLDLLGVVLFGFDRRFAPGKDGAPRRPVGQVVRAREWAASDLQRAGTDAPVFDAWIRNAKTVAEQCRKRGQTVFELGRSRDGAKWWEVRKDRAAGTVLANERAEEVGYDFEDLAAEVVERIQRVEREESA